MGKLRPKGIGTASAEKPWRTGGPRTVFVAVRSLLSQNRDAGWAACGSTREGAKEVTRARHPTDSDGNRRRSTGWLTDRALGHRGQDKHAEASNCRRGGRDVLQDTEPVRHGLRDCGPNPSDNSVHVARRAHYTQVGANSSLPRAPPSLSGTGTWRLLQHFVQPWQLE
jgi:hypothetical protein